MYTICRLFTLECLILRNISKSYYLKSKYREIVKTKSLPCKYMLSSLQLKTVQMFYPPHVYKICIIYNCMYLQVEKHLS